MRILTVSVVFAAGCSTPSETPLRRPASAPAPAARPSPPVAGTVSSSPRADPIAEPADEDIESRLERDEVHGAGIDIEVSWWTLTGTTHVAEQLAITTARGTLRLESSEDDDGPTLPLVEQIYSAGPSRWVVLGWSSFGEGMQTEHAWLIDGKGAPRIVDTLAWTTDRRHAGLTIDTTKNVLVGIPLPQAQDADGESTLHNQDGWALVHGKKSFTLEQVARLPTAEENLITLRHYTPPSHRSSSDRGWSGRVVWFSARKRFVLERR